MPPSVPQSTTSSTVTIASRFGRSASPRQPARGPETTRHCTTSLVLLCWRHHHDFAHHPQWHLKLLPDATVFSSRDLLGWPTVEAVKTRDKSQLRLRTPSPQPSPSLGGRSEA